MTLQIIQSIDGKAEYVLLPVKVYNTLRDEIEKELKKKYSSDDYVPFELTDYVDNPVALVRINAGITQETLAKHMRVTQAYISKLEAQSKITAKVLKKVTPAINMEKNSNRYFIPMFKKVYCVNKLYQLMFFELFGCEYCSMSSNLCCCFL